MNGRSPSMQQMRNITKVDNKGTPAITTETRREKETQSNGSKHAQISVFVRKEKRCRRRLNMELLLLRDDDRLSGVASSWQREASSQLIK